MPTWKPNPAYKKAKYKVSFIDDKTGKEFVHLKPEPRFDMDEKKQLIPVPSHILVED